MKSSELFESPVYLEEVADVLCILQAGTQNWLKKIYVLLHFVFPCMAWNI